MRQNIDHATVLGFGQQWGSFTQEQLKPNERTRIFDEYFHIFPWDSLPVTGARGVDVGCGSGRWAALVAPKVAELHLIDASAVALGVARQNLAYIHNVRFHHASVDAMPLEDGTLDFAYSLGVLHHVPDTQAAIGSIARKLKPGAPFLVYLYYALDNRAVWFKALWAASDKVRSVVSRLPFRARYAVSQAVAALVYWPLARGAALLENLAIMPADWPLSQYRDKSFYVMQTDALDRLGTRLEHRFTRGEITQMLEAAGFIDIRFSDAPPYWCAVGIKGKDSVAV